MTQLWTLNQFNQALEERLDELQRGQIRIQDLPSAVAAWFFAGEAYGRASRNLEIEQLEREANRWYYLANTPPWKRQAHIEARLSTALEHATETQWNQLDKDLTSMARQGTNTIESAPEAEIEGTHDSTNRNPRRWRQAA